MNREIDYVKALCEEYAKSKRDIVLAVKDLDILEGKATRAKSEGERRMFDYGIQTRREQLKFDRLIVSEFEHLVKSLNPQEKAVIVQLYVKKKRWKQVVDLDNKPLHSERVSRIRKKAFAHMAETRRNRTLLKVEGFDEVEFEDGVIMTKG